MIEFKIPDLSLVGKLELRKAQPERGRIGLQTKIALIRGDESGIRHQGILVHALFLPFLQAHAAKTNFFAIFVPI